MPDAPVPSQWIDVSRVDDVRDVVHRAVACLAQGGVVGLATETVYAPGRMCPAARRGGTVRAMRGAAAVTAAHAAAQRPGRSYRLGSARSRKSAGGWPGGFGPGRSRWFFRATVPTVSTIVFPTEVKPLVSPDGDVALRSPSQPIVREVLRLLPAPLVISMVTDPEQSIPSTADSLRAAGSRHGDRLGPDPVSTVRDRRQGRRASWAIERAGRDRRRDPGRMLESDHPVRLHRQHLPQPDGRGHLQGPAGAAARLLGG